MTVQGTGTINTADDADIDIDATNTYVGEGATPSLGLIQTTGDGQIDIDGAGDVWCQTSGSYISSNENLNIGHVTPPVDVDVFASCIVEAHNANSNGAGYELDIRVASAGTIDVGTSTTIGVVQTFNSGDLSMTAGYNSGNDNGAGAGFFTFQSDGTFVQTTEGGNIRLDPGTGTLLVEEQAHVETDVAGNIDIDAGYIQVYSQAEVTTFSTTSIISLDGNSANTDSVDIDYGKVESNGKVTSGGATCTIGGTVQTYTVTRGGQITANGAGTDGTLHLTTLAGGSVSVTDGDSGSEADRDTLVQTTNAGDLAVSACTGGDVLVDEEGDATFITAIRTTDDSSSGNLNVFTWSGADDSTGTVTVQGDGRISTLEGDLEIQTYELLVQTEGSVSSTSGDITLVTLDTTPSSGFVEVITSGYVETTDGGYIDVDAESTLVGSTSANWGKIQTTAGGNIDVDGPTLVRVQNGDGHIKCTSTGNIKIGHVVTPLDVQIDYSGTVGTTTGDIEITSSVSVKAGSDAAPGPTRTPGFVQSDSGFIQIGTPLFEVYGTKGEVTTSGDIDVNADIAHIGGDLGSTGEIVTTGLGRIWIDGDNEVIVQQDGSKISAATTLYIGHDNTNAPHATADTTHAGVDPIPPATVLVYRSGLVETTTAGFCANPSYTTQSTCEGDSSVWTDATVDIDTATDGTITVGGDSPATIGVVETDAGGNIDFYAPSGTVKVWQDGSYVQTMSGTAGGNIKVDVTDGELRVEVKGVIRNQYTDGAATDEPEGHIDIDAKTVNVLSGGEVTTADAESDIVVDGFDSGSGDYAGSTLLVSGYQDRSSKIDSAGGVDIGNTACPGTFVSAKATEGGDIRTRGVAGTTGHLYITTEDGGEIEASSSTSSTDSDTLIETLGGGDILLEACNAGSVKVDDDGNREFDTAVRTSSVGGHVKVWTNTGGTGGSVTVEDGGRVEAMHTSDSGDIEIESQTTQVLTGGAVVCDGSTCHVEVNGNSADGDSLTVDGSDEGSCDKVSNDNETDCNAADSASGVWAVNPSKVVSGGNVVFGGTTAAYACGGTIDDVFVTNGGLVQALGATTDGFVAITLKSPSGTLTVRDEGAGTTNGLDTTIETTGGASTEIDIKACGGGTVLVQDDLDDTQITAIRSVNGGGITVDTDASAATGWIKVVLGALVTAEDVAVAGNVALSTLRLEVLSTSEVSVAESTSEVSATGVGSNDSVFISGGTCTGATSTDAAACLSTSNSPSGTWDGSACHWNTQVSCLAATGAWSADYKTEVKSAGTISLGGADCDSADRLNDVTVQDGASVEAADDITISTGDGGSVTVLCSAPTTANAANDWDTRIATLSGGDVNLNACGGGSVLVQDEHNAEPQTLVVTNAGGNVNIDTEPASGGSVTVQLFGRVEAASTADAGNVNIDTQTLKVLTGGAVVVAESSSAATVDGDGGASDVIRVDGGVCDANYATDSTCQAAGGTWSGTCNIMYQTETECDGGSGAWTGSDASKIDSAGSITLGGAACPGTVNDVFVYDGGLITTTGTLAAGDVTITVANGGDVTVQTLVTPTRDTAIETTDGGDITVTACSGGSVRVQHDLATSGSSTINCLFIHI